MTHVTFHIHFTYCVSLFNVSKSHVIQPLHWTNIATIISFDQLQQPMHILECAHVYPFSFSCTFSSLSISSSILTLLGVLELTLPSDSTPGHKCSLCLPFRRVLVCTSTCQCIPLYPSSLSSLTSICQRAAMLFRLRV